MRLYLSVLSVVSILVGVPVLAQNTHKNDGVQKYARYAHNGKTAYGRVVGETIRELAGAPFDQPEETGKTLKLSEVEILIPSEPSKIFAVGMNYASHASSSGNPPMFAKFPSTLLAHKKNIIIPKDAGDPHYEGEMVIVIGKKAKNVARKDVHKYVFGITAGNDVSERRWQSSDLQWLRGKASDGFGPVGPYIVTGLNYKDLQVQTRLNGEVRQSESTKNMIHGVDKVVSWLSNYFTLMPGDMIFTGTPGSTRGMKAGDVVEVEIQGVGILRNRLVKEGAKN